jgi:hypothetical protein
MDILIKARMVADYVTSRWDLPKRPAIGLAPVSENIAAILVDAVFQAGLNYRNVVLPRVWSVALAYPRMTSLQVLEGEVETERFTTALRWAHPEKPRRLRELIAFLRAKRLDSIQDLQVWLSVMANRSDLLKLRGIGRKTVDYLSKLVGLSTIAVDRHAQRLLRDAGIVSRGYEEAKRILEFAADLLRMTRYAFDRLMWQTLSPAPA